MHRRVFNLIPKGNIGFTTATPAWNRITDWLAYAFLLRLTSDLKDLWSDGLAVDRCLDEGFEAAYGIGDYDNMLRYSAEDNAGVAKLQEITQKWGWK